MPSSHDEIHQPLKRSHAEAHIDTSALKEALAPDTSPETARMDTSQFPLTHYRTVDQETLVEEALQNFDENLNELLLNPVRTIDFFEGSSAYFANDDHNPHNIIGELALISLVGSIVQAFYRFLKPSSQKTAIEILEGPKPPSKFTSLEADKDFLDFKVIASRILYERAYDYKPTYAALVKNIKTGKDFFVRVPLDSTLIKEYSTENSNLRKIIHYNLDEHLLASLRAKQKPANEEPIQTSSKQLTFDDFWSRSTKLGSNLFKLLFIYGAWLLTIKTLFMSLAGIALSTTGLFLIPLAIVGLLSSFKILSTVRNINNPAPSIEDRLAVETLAKMQLVDDEAEKIEKDLKGLHLLLNIPEKEINHSLKFSDRISNHNPTAEKTIAPVERKWWRIGVVTLSSFIGGFVMGLVTSDLMSTLLTTFFHVAGNAVLGAGIPFLISLGVGLVFGVIGFKATKKSEEKRANDFHTLKETLFGKINSLNESVGYKRGLLAELKQLFQHNHSDAHELFKNTHYKHALKEFTARSDNSEFMKRMQLRTQSQSGKISRLLKKGASRFLILFSGAGTGSMLVQVTFGLIGTLAAATLVTNPFSLSAVALILAFAATGMAIAKFMEKIAKNQILKSEADLNEASTQLLALQKESSVLDQQIHLLQAVEAKQKLGEHSPIKREKAHHKLKELPAYKEFKGLSADVETTEENSHPEEGSRGGEHP